MDAFKEHDFQVRPDNNSAIVGELGEDVGVPLWRLCCRAALLVCLGSGETSARRMLHCAFPLQFLGVGYTAGTVSSARACLPGPPACS
jgi:hypothetical protein